MKIVTHENLWWWGKSYTLITDNGKAMIEVCIKDERPDAACIQSLLVHESVRQQGIANAMLTFAENKAKKAGCEHPLPTPPAQEGRWPQHIQGFRRNGSCTGARAKWLIQWM